MLAMLLGSHPEICTVGELKVTSLGDPDLYRCSCHLKIVDCPFWCSVRDAMRDRGIDFEVTAAGTDIRTGASHYVRRLLRPLCRGMVLEKLRDALLFLSPNWRASLPRIQHRNRALVESISALTGKQVIVDSSKIGLRLKYLQEIPGLDVVVIRLIRDGRAVSLTYMDPARFADARDVSLRGGGSGGDRREQRLPMMQAAREWLRSNEEAEAVLKQMDARKWTQVHYEDICQNPVAELSRLYAFLGVDPAGRQLDFRSIEQHVVGNGMRLDTTSEIRLDERWRDTLNQDELRVFDRVAGRMNRRLGYQ